MPGPKVVRATVETSRNRDPGHPVDGARDVQSLEELYEACRTSAGTAELVSVVLHGPHGEVRLHFGGVLRDGQGR
jgi:hypothetical protein